MPRHISGALAYMGSRTGGSRRAQHWRPRQGWAGSCGCCSAPRRSACGARARRDGVQRLLRDRRHGAPPRRLTGARARSARRQLCADPAERSPPAGDFGWRPPLRNRQIRSPVLRVDLVGPRPIWPARVGGPVDPDGSRRVQSDRLDDQADDQIPQQARRLQASLVAGQRLKTVTRRRVPGCLVATWRHRALKGAKGRLSNFWCRAGAVLGLARPLLWARRLVAAGRQAVKAR
jgi:hypothetical protein